MFYNISSYMKLPFQVYKTSILIFKDRDKYVSGEFRFRHGYCKHNPRKMVKTWAEKEMRNLIRLIFYIYSCYFIKRGHSVFIHVTNKICVYTLPSYKWHTGIRYVTCLPFTFIRAFICPLKWHFEIMLMTIENLYQRVKSSAEIKGNFVDPSVYIDQGSLFYP